MREIIQKNGAKKPINGQGMIEYILVFAAVVVVLLAAVSPGGIFATRLDESLDEAVTGIDCMAYQDCYLEPPAICPPPPAGCP